MLLEGLELLGYIDFRLTRMPIFVGWHIGRRTWACKCKLRPKSLFKPNPKPSSGLGFMAKPAPILGMGMGYGLLGSTVFGHKSGLSAGSISCPPIPCFNPSVKSMEVVQVAEITFDVFSACWVSFGEACFRSTRFAGGGLGYSDRN